MMSQDNNRTETFKQTFICTGKYTEESIKKLEETFAELRALGYTLNHSHSKQLDDDMKEIHIVWEKSK